MSDNGYIGSSLSGFESKFITIPEFFINNCDDDAGKRLAAYTYFNLRVGLDGKVLFNIEHIVSWCGYVPDHKKGKIDEKFMLILNWFCDIGFISCCEVVDHCNGTNKIREPYTKNLTAILNQKWYKTKTDTERFAILYMDEIIKILDYDCKKRSVSITTSNLLFVFAYLRLHILTRNSKEGEDLEHRLKSPESYYGFYKDISSDTGITAKSLSGIFNILYELELIYMQRVKRRIVENNNLRFVTLPTFFANRYKRLKGKLIYSGEEYYKNEVQNMIQIQSAKFNKLKCTGTKVEDGETNYDIKWLETL